MTLFRLVTSALFPVVLAVVMYFLETKTKFKKLPPIVNQIIIGIVFGVSACLATEFGIPTNDVVLNVRGASPLTAGLIFGGPAGIIAGTIGAVYIKYAGVALSKGGFVQDGYDATQFQNAIKDTVKLAAKIDITGFDDILDIQ